MDSSFSQIIYIGDPMCSWCYGISKELDKVKKTTEKTLDFKMLMGGLRPHGKETMKELSDFLRHHWDSVSIASGLSFNYNILSNNEFVYDTEPPSRACIVARYMHPDRELAFYHRIQKAFYFDNIDICNIANYKSICEQLQIDFIDFQDKFNSVKFKKKTADEFKKVKELNISGFPTIILNHLDRYYLIASGFTNAETMTSKIYEIINK